MKSLALIVSNLLAVSSPAELRRMMRGLIAALENCDAVYPVDKAGGAPLKSQMP